MEETTICDLCSREIPEDEVQHCEKCERDGICGECLIGHDCEPEDEP